MCEANVYLLKDGKEELVLRGGGPHRAKRGYCLFGEHIFRAKKGKGADKGNGFGFTPRCA